MNKERSEYSQGFSAVELLITLFIAAAFIATGYQLYSFAVSSGGDTAARIKASSIGYEKIRAWQATVNSSCSPTTTTFPANSGLTNPTFTVNCQQNVSNSSSSSPLVRIEVVVNYGPSTSRQAVYHAMYVSPN